MTGAPARAVAGGASWHSGRFAVIAIALGLLAILAGYFFTLPEPWLRAFGADIALRAEADPNPPMLEDTRQESPRGLADNPYICLASIIAKPWDRFVIVPSGANMDDYPLLAGAEWDEADRAKTAATLGQDDRYQLLVLLNRNRLVDHQFFYTFWGDLSALARRDGFTPETAIFTARSLGGIYIVEPADGVAPSACPSIP